MARFVEKIVLGLLFVAVISVASVAGSDLTGATFDQVFSGLTLSSVAFKIASDIVDGGGK